MPPVVHVDNDSRRLDPARNQEHTPLAPAQGDNLGLELLTNSRRSGVNCGAISR